MPIEQCALIIGIILVGLVLMYETARFLYWPFFNRFSSRLKHPHKRALLIVQESKKCLCHLRKRLKASPKTPELAEDIVRRMRQLLPIENILLTEQARLHAMVDHIKDAVFQTGKRRRHFHNAGQATVSAGRFEIMLYIHSRLDKLDHQAVELKAQIDTLLQLAERYKTAEHYARLASCLKTAEKMQQYNLRLVKAIHNTEKDLVLISRELAKTGNNGAPGPSSTRSKS